MGSESDQARESAKSGEKPNTSNGGDDAPSPVVSKEVLEQLPQPLREVVEQHMLAVSSGPLPHPILSKLQPGHIDKIIDYT
jgi:hypothetical protein